jgi:hypothetical protein
MFIYIHILFYSMCLRGRDGMVVWNYTTCAISVTTNVVSSNPALPIQHYVIKFVSDLR